MTETVYIVAGARTAIGTYGGTLKDAAPIDLASHVFKAAMERAGIAAETVEQCVLGNVIHTEARDMYVSRVAALQAGLAENSRALTVNRLCGSGLQAIVTATQMIQLGDISTAIAGGVEVMSRGGYLLPAHRWGQRMGEGAVVDMMTGALTDPFGIGHMGITAENIAEESAIDRATQDAFAVESHQKAQKAIEAGYFTSQIAPYEIKQRKKTITFDTDEHFRADAQLADFEKLRPVFKKDGSVTAGNASGINDGAAAVVLTNEASLPSAGKPMVRIVSYGNAGVAPRVMGMGPVEAVQQALSRANLSISDIDVIESNEAFAVQACAVSKNLDLPADKVNPNGGAIALGHPIGATGAIITVKTMYELERIGGRYGLITMCIGGGQGIAMIIERVN